MLGGVAEVLTHYRPSLHLLQQYDEGDLLAPEGTAPQWRLDDAEARGIIDRLVSWTQPD